VAAAADWVRLLPHMVIFIVSHSIINNTISINSTGISLSSSSNNNNNIITTSSSNSSNNVMARYLLRFTNNNNSIITNKITLIRCQWEVTIPEVPWLPVTTHPLQWMKPIEGWGND
jgi:hypothetical protein